MQKNKAKNKKKQLQKQMQLKQQTTAGEAAAQDTVLTTSDQTHCPPRSAAQLEDSSSSRTPEPRKSQTRRPPIAALPANAMTAYIVQGLTELQAASRRLSQRAEAAGDLKTALNGIRVSKSILTKLVKIMEKHPQLAANWQPPVSAAQPPAAAESLPTPASVKAAAANPEPAAVQPAGWGEPSGSPRFHENCHPVMAGLKSVIQRFSSPGGGVVNF